MIAEGFSAHFRPSLDIEGGAELSPPFVPFARVAILGVGLMGGSLGMALRARSLAQTVVGWDHNGEALSLAQQRGAIDLAETDLDLTVQNADAIFLAVPVAVAPDLLERIAPHVSPTALLSDLGSVKTAVVATGARLFGERFVGGHPMAGSEQSGVGAARADLFADAAWAIVAAHPDSSQSQPSLSRLIHLVTALEARPLLLDAATHDRLVALISHLPHALAFALRGVVESDPERDLALQLAGGSYRDMTRVASSDPALWRGIFHANRDFLLAALTTYEQQLNAFIQAVRDDDAGTTDPLLLLNKPGS
ncbi:MAG: Prephenate dehydrogenase [Chthonomonadaceae bacterium]|nr:Prephenate dehydrogenase [Chthonomonadaceae bacterium]